MKKDALLALIAETGYNVGYGAKKHFATYDIVEKLPGWVALFSAAAGILALFIPYMEQKWIAAFFIVISIGTAAILLYDRDKAKYADAGSQLTARFHELRLLYQAVKEQPDGVDLPSFEKQHKDIQDQALQIPISKQIFMSDWYAHYKFFWQGQTKWMDEQIHFKLFRDKMPLGMIVALFAGVLALIWLAFSSTPIFVSSFCKAIA
ncbi:SLATT domain-containing protein [Variovorax ginsengisoli]|uniref:SLATT domain-containing protein n=1 Tax=Variovorax ginsengisoli TaxID=363844 RepID=A0ABT8SDQ0_9BURK|nr:SLATT domain-containing protein [Variovorax ginsengisoli]MDN8617142.1 SLATT domain-containing protein [Variovorax ginsengisoli]MDO1536312.1 SLATT domain-containing protein [Variovorax ginsengisoli]